MIAYDLNAEERERSWLAEDEAYWRQWELNRWRRIRAAELLYARMMSRG